MISALYQAALKAEGAAEMLYEAEQERVDGMIAEAIDAKKMGIGSADLGPYWMELRQRRERLRVARALVRAIEDELPPDPTGE